jgi:hypothetical protein
MATESLMSVDPSGMKTQRDCNIGWVGRMVQERLRRVGHRDG